MIHRTVTNLAELHNVLSQLDADGVWLFRGQTDSSWGLIPSIFRGIDSLVPKYEDDDAEWITRIERDIYREFEQHARQYKPTGQSRWESLALAQHYGTPTRLLDWTRSALIAAYFAVATFKPISAAVWCLNLRNYLFPPFLGRITKTYAHRVAVIHKVVGKRQPSFFQEVSRPFTSGPAGPPDPVDEVDEMDTGFLFILDPPRGDDRLRAQDGLFTIYYSFDDYDLVWDLSQHFQQRETTIGKEMLCKIEIPEEKREALCRELEMHDNMNWHRLIPDLVGLGKWLARNRNAEFAATEALRK
ncbi:MAG: FRG domain-containing protein [Deltaproteobacteria bacterium]|nr:FRG domain-containing protein [Deltaproteobacteria bacterium]MBF0524850.1 FRG domain-containing protein [Deltaproteobacteria bacterium]